VLAQLGLGADAVEAALARWLPDTTGTAKIDAVALAELGVEVLPEGSMAVAGLDDKRGSARGVCRRMS
jgi:hypothetical protein